MTSIIKAKMKDLNPKGVTLLSYEWDGEPLTERKIIKVSFPPDLGNKLLKLYPEVMVKFEVEFNKEEKFTILTAEALDEIPKIVVDSFTLIKKIVEEAGEEITKQDFYEKYTQEASVSSRTAREHLRQALQVGVVKEKGYYSLQPSEIEKEEKEENEK